MWVPCERRTTVICAVYQGKVSSLDRLNCGGIQLDLTHDYHSAFPWLSHFLRIFNTLHSSLVYLSKTGRFVLPVHHGPTPFPVPTASNAASYLKPFPLLVSQLWDEILCVRLKLL